MLLPAMCLLLRRRDCGGGWVVVEASFLLAQRIARGSWIATSLYDYVLCLLFPRGNLHG